jgi:hypothetical protein
VVILVERRGWVTRSGSTWVNWQPEEPAGLGGRRQPSTGGTSRVTGDGQARICERLGAKFPGPTRQQETELRQTGLRRTLRKHPNSHREAKATAPVLDSTRVAVEKLLRAKFAKIKLCQDALQTTFSIFLDIFYPPNFRCFEENGVFQHPLAITLVDRGRKCCPELRLHGASTRPCRKRKERGTQS